jgi:hypothetical protein
MPPPFQASVLSWERKQLIRQLQMDELEDIQQADCRRTASCYFEDCPRAAQTFQDYIFLGRGDSTWAFVVATSAASSSA